ncbi:MAG: dihydrodipicolinate synthase family protein [Acidobacteriaceae bacterium]|nr:dihydrodipicolinate synthase family protein [Acidobacteriaceae bacterium]
MKLQGIFPALTSSFDHEGNLYKVKVFHNIEKLNQVGLSGYVVGGSTGETPLLSVEERFQLMAWVKEASAEGKTLIAGVGAESVHETVQNANRAADLGYHAALVLTPFYYRRQMHRPETQALFFRAVADRSKLPVLIYNIPQVTGYDLPDQTIAELSHHPNIIGMKDSSGNLEKMNEVVRLVKPGFQTLSGAGINFWEALRIGASGAILAIANPLPYACITIWEAFRTREHEAGHDWQERIAPAAQLIASKYGIAGLKYAMDLNGYYGGPPRLPFIPPSPEAKAEIEEAFADLRS